MKNIEDIHKAIASIDAVKSDSERAHAMEDKLHISFIEAISDGSFEGDIREAAKLVLTTSAIKFERWTN